MLPYTIEVTRVSSKIDAELAKSGQMLSFPDVVITSTAFSII